MAELKTRPTGASVESFIRGVDEARRADCRVLVEIMARVTGSEPVMWGPSIVGFGGYHFVYESGREGDWFLVGFAPRKTSLVLYIMEGFEAYESLLSGLGRFKTGKSCLYIKRLDDVDLDVLEALVRASVDHVRDSSS